MYNDISESMKKVAFWGRIVGYILVFSGILHAVTGLFSYIIGAIPGIIEIVLGYYLLKIADEASQFDWETLELSTESIMFLFMKYLRLKAVLMIIGIFFFALSFLLLSTTSNDYLPFP
ncbi:DUF5362 family protein [Rubeoparvulum massiliense]|uniref:DUF5362 family protein n=1 Tax=Rubeoparvulum massiliense TaxID=1631346 RepID=UPI00065DDF75|nr:DUF5362 family protein [Rubeoparvulum massiliense]